MPLGYLAPAILAGAFNAASSHFGGHLHLNVSQAFVNAAYGMSAAFMSHELINSILRRKHVGITRGDRVVRRVQAAAYTLPLLFGSLIYKVPDFRVEFRQASAIEQRNPATEPSHKAHQVAYTPAPQRKS